jgi:hypothetical protein
LHCIADQWISNRLSEKSNNYLNCNLASLHSSEDQPSNQHENIFGIFSHHVRDNNTVHYCPWYGKLDKKEGLAYNFFFMPKSNIDQTIHMDSIKELAHTQLTITKIFLSNAVSGHFQQGFIFSNWSGQ